MIMRKTEGKTMTAFNTDNRKEISMNEAMAIAWKIDPEADQVTEFEKGYFFIRKEDMLSMSDSGFVVSKSDGEVYQGFAAHEFLQAE